MSLVMMKRNEVLSEQKEYKNFKNLDITLDHSFFDIIYNENYYEQQNQRKKET